MKPCHDAYEEIASFKMSPEQIHSLLRQPGVKITETCMLALAMLDEKG